MTEKTNKPIKVIGYAPALSVDGHGIGVNVDGNFFQLSFIQLQPEDPSASSEETTATVVASVRMNVNQVERYVEDLQKNLENFKSITNKKIS